ncbi:MAG TPA: NAD(P)-dependent oxidoreductase [Kribbella sp.]|uniref:NAD(P)-dependent oxidoreductase n=1 Tax=Kribbella sp. TaxID=1871183 RepID=UPI002D765D86|nr:NAD(P)-dependent oxidoreductase [Kribbella sp.]HET6299297.1 NAD(P)-dependent oxidoreductase [Kribbella sp.]
MAATTRKKIGFIGLGHMGGPMAARLLDAGHHVHGLARNKERARSDALDGLPWHQTPREVAEASEIVITSVPDDDVLNEIASGPDGILAGLGAGKIWIEMSTVSPRVNRRLAAQAEALEAAMLDAPVSGSFPQAQAGTLMILVGGDESAFAHVDAVLREFGTPAYVGDHGLGLALKLAININLAAQLVAFSEGLQLAARAGIDQKLAADLMVQSGIGSPALKAREQFVLDLPDEAWFDVGLMQKDLRLALDLGTELRSPLPSTTLADHLLDAARAAGYEHRDIAVLYRVLEEMAPVRPTSPDQ